MRKGIYTDLTGKKFGKLIAIKFVNTTNINGRIRVYWLFKCDCGNEKVLRADSVISGGTISCGCAFTGNPTHKQINSITYRSWIAMGQRCNNPNHTSYKDYGARGIKICERWKKFENFWGDMGDRPSKEYSIGRKDNDGNYCPENCEWQTDREQGNNTRHTHYLTHDGKTQSVREWERELGFLPTTINNRLRANWPEEELFGKLRRCVHKETQVKNENR